MKESYFVHTKEPEWAEFLKSLDRLEKRWNKGKSSNADGFTDRYRSIAHDLTIARTRGYSNQLIVRLNNLVQRGHNLLYTKRLGFVRGFLNFFTHTFPRAVRFQKMYILLSFLAFVCPGLGMSYMISTQPEFIHTVLSDEQLYQYQEMYDPDSKLQSQERTAMQNITMFGHYIFNNTSIGLLVFINGLVFGIGSIIVLTINGIFIGSIITYLCIAGYSSTVLPFVVGHGAFELTAIVIAGAAGLRMAKGVFIPGVYARKTSIKIASKEAFILCGGFFTMFILAAFIEAFWSPSDFFPNSIKYSIGLLLWIAVFYYFLFVGRDKYSHR